MENCHLWWILPSKMVIFYSYVKLPEGTFHGEHDDHWIAGGPSQETWGALLSTARYSEQVQLAVSSSRSFK